MELEFISEEFSGNIEILATDYDDMLTIENLFGDNGGETTCSISLVNMNREIPKRCPLPSMTTVFSKVVMLVENSRLGCWLGVGDVGYAAR